MCDFENIEQLYQGHYCSNCSKQLFCKKNNEIKTCKEWEKELDASVLKVVRTAFPNSIKGDFVKEFTMQQSHGIYYIEPVYTENEEKNETT